MRGKYQTIPKFLLLSCTALLLWGAQAHAGAARCFMHGIVVPKLENKEKTSLSDMIRLHFDVSSPEDKGKCEQLMEAYCHHNVKGKDYSPARLKGSFKPDVDKSTETVYTFTENCKLESN